MSNNRAWKDRWIKSMIQRKYLKVEPDGTIWRCVKADKDGTLLSDVYKIVKVQTHKPTGRVYSNFTWVGITKSVLINRVVAIRFLPNPEGHEQVNHKDGDKSNNAVSNLEWSSGSENEKHAHRTGLKTGRGSSNSNAKLTANDVREIRASQLSVQELAEEYGVGRSTISNVIARKSWGHI